jgi:hypothetical protein
MEITRRTWKQTSDREVSAFERTIGVRLPEEYRAFLLASNGGVPATATFDFEDAVSGRRDASSIQHFFGIHEGEIGNLRAVTATYMERLPHGLLPVARDDGGNLICLAIAGPRKGEVLFWDHDHEAEEGEPPDYSNISVLAPSFTAFIAGLRSSG